MNRKFLKRSMWCLLCLWFVSATSLSAIGADISNSDITVLKSIQERYDNLKAKTPNYCVVPVQVAIYKLSSTKTTSYNFPYDLPQVLNNPVELGPVIADYLDLNKRNEIVKPQWFLVRLSREISTSKKEALLSRFLPHEIANYLIHIANLYEEQVDTLVPDIVFRPESGLVFPYEGTFYAFVSNFASTHGDGTRIREKKFNRKAFADYGFQIIDVPEKYPFEGGAEVKYVKHGDRVDAIFGWGFRTSGEAVAWVTNKIKDIVGNDFTKVNIIPAHIINEDYYHLDTALKEIPLVQNGKIVGETIMYYPSAFDRETQLRLQRSFPGGLILSKYDAENFACNSPTIDRSIIMDNRISNELKTELTNRGIKVVPIDLSEFFKAGGGAKCLICELDQDIFSFDVENNNKIQMIKSIEGIFDVIYVNDSYMTESIGTVDKTLAEKQHKELIRLLREEGMDISLMSTSAFKESYDFEKLHRAVSEVVTTNESDATAIDELCIQAMTYFENTKNTNGNVGRGVSPKLRSVIAKYNELYNKVSSYSWSTLYRAMHEEQASKGYGDLEINGKVVRQPEQLFALIKVIEE